MSGEQETTSTDNPSLCSSDQPMMSSSHTAAGDGSLSLYMLTDLLQGLKVKEELKEKLDQKLTVAEQVTTPLIIAAKNGNLDAVKVLLDYGADVEARGT